jgi:hypothetical protein
LKRFETSGQALGLRIPQYPIHDNLQLKLSRLVIAVAAAQDPAAGFKTSTILPSTAGFQDMAIRSCCNLPLDFTIIIGISTTITAALRFCQWGSHHHQLGPDIARSCNL